MKPVLLEKDPVQTQDEEITEKHTRWLEKQIQETPQYWYGHTNAGKEK